MGTMLPVAAFCQSEQTSSISPERFVHYRSSMVIIISFCLGFWNFFISVHPSLKKF